MNPQVGGAFLGSLEFSDANMNLATGALTPVYDVLPSPFTKEGEGTYSDPFELARMGNISTKIGMEYLGSKEGLLVLSPEELQKQYGLNTNTSMNIAQALLIRERMDREARIQMRNSYIDDRVSSPMLKTLGRDFVSGIAGGMLDPANVATGFIAGAGVAALGLGAVTGIAVGGLAEGSAEMFSGLGLREYGYNYGVTDAAMDLAAGPVIQLSLKGAYVPIKYGVKHIPIPASIRKLDFKMTELLMGKKPLENTPLDDIQEKTISSKVSPTVSQISPELKAQEPYIQIGGTPFLSPKADAEAAIKALDFSSGKIVDPDLMPEFKIVHGFKEDTNVLVGDGDIDPNLISKVTEKFKELGLENEIEDSGLESGIHNFLHSLYNLKQLDQDSKAYEAAVDVLKEEGYDLVSYSKDGTLSHILLNEEKAVGKNLDIPYSKAEPEKLVPPPKTEAEKISQQEAVSETKVSNTKTYDNPDNLLNHVKDLYTTIQNQKLNKQNNPELAGELKTVKENLKSIEEEYSVEATGENLDKEHTIQIEDSSTLTQELTASTIKENISTVERATKAGVFCVRNS